MLGIHRTAKHLIPWCALCALALGAACDRGDPPKPPTEQGSTTPKTPASLASSMTSAPATTPPALGAPQAPSVAAVAPDNSGFSELDWDTLIPEDWRPDKIMAEYPIDDLSDDDPRAAELMARLKTLWDTAPVVSELDGRQVKLAGFVVPLEMDSQTIGEFLLVPYYGACIHVPPPPANQTVHVITDKDAGYRGELFDTVWVSGTLSVEASSSALAEAGYQIHAVKVEPYE